MTPPNIHKHTAAICRKLGLEPKNVRQLTITPRSVEAEVYLVNEKGSKYLVDAPELLPADGDDVTGFSQVPAMEIRTFEVVA
jgi:hypothetical protein